ncbi:hypothetical protein Agub_g11371, partial [Astrephomene gubernaculifera]
GFLSGSIVTVDPEEGARLGRPWTRRYIYNQQQCGRCKGPVRTWRMAGRTVYCCERCQPLALPLASPSQQHLDSPLPPPQQPQTPRQAAAAATAATAAMTPQQQQQEEQQRQQQLLQQLSPSRRAALAAARPPRLFPSRCAPDDAEDVEEAMEAAGGSGGTAAAAAALQKLTVPQLRARLASLHADTRGNRQQLIARLQQVQAAGRQQVGAAAAAQE